MDGENNGKPYEQMDDLFFFPPYFWFNTHMKNLRSTPPQSLWFECLWRCSFQFQMLSKWEVPRVETSHPLKFHSKHDCRAKQTFGSNGFFSLPSFGKNTVCRKPCLAPFACLRFETETLFCPLGCHGNPKNTCWLRKPTIQNNDKQMISNFSRYRLFLFTSFFFPTSFWKKSSDRSTTSLPIIKFQVLVLALEEVNIYIYYIYIYFIHIHTVGRWGSPGDTWMMLCRSGEAGVYI